MKRFLNSEESAKVGYAVGILLWMSEKWLEGDYVFNDEQIEKISKANAVLSDFTTEEQLELLERGIKAGAN